MNKKGFSFIELLVVLFIMGVLAFMLIPSLTSSSTSSRENADQATISNLETTVCAAIQGNSIYKNAKKIADLSTTNEITIVYCVDSDNVMTLEECEVIINIDGNEVIIKSDSDGEIGETLLKIKNDVSAYIESNLGVVTLQSKNRSNKEYRMKVSFPDVMFRVTITTILVE